MSLPKETMEILEALAPELRESEDERIRKAIIELLKEVGRDDTGISENAKCMIAWLEKQKENPKSAGSIPSDRTADAKCENRWHKVADSMPDNPREVLCKDEAGNYFIGRYYVGEGWEISNYDDEDKPHHLNPPVSKWIDFPSEKQKEQKPAEWSEEDEEMINSIINVVCGVGSQPNGLREKQVNFLKSLRPQKLDASKLENFDPIEVLYRIKKEWPVAWEKVAPMQEWSEEDEKTLDDACCWIAEYAGYLMNKNYGKACMLMGLTDKLKSLRPKPSWKPSEEHLSALLAIFNDPNNIGSQTCQLALTDLYEHLKKLM